MIKVKANYIMNIGPKMAAEWLENYRYIHQRPTTPSVVNRYALAMQNGEWIDGKPMMLAYLSEDTKKKFLVDGQHRLRAIVQSGTVEQFVVTEVQCNTEDDIAQAYYTTDRNRGRSYNDAYRTTGIGEKYGLAKTEVNKLGAALRFLMVDFVRTPEKTYAVTDGMILDAIGTYINAIRMYLDTTRKAPAHISTPMRRAAPFALGIATFHYATTIYGEDRVTQFWDGIATDDGLRSGDPRKVAVIHLTNTAMGHARNNGSRVVSSEYQARYLANLFNAWMEGREYGTGLKRGFTKVFDAKAPINISGTPWQG